MSEQRKQRIINELGMLTGTYSDDIDYLVYLALKNGDYNPNGYVAKPAEIRQEEKLGVLTFDELVQAIQRNGKS